MGHRNHSLGRDKIDKKKQRWVFSEVYRYGLAFATIPYFTFASGMLLRVCYKVQLVSCQIVAPLFPLEMVIQTDYPIFLNITLKSKLQ